MNKVFIPHSACSVLSGDCFVVGRCLDNCRERSVHDLNQRVRDLEERAAQLEARIIQLERAR